MEFYIGGYAQGKLDYVLQIHEGEKLKVVEREVKDSSGERIVWNHFHLWVKEMVEKGENPQQRVMDFIEKNKDCIIICDEVGNGIVPVQQSERTYRACLGRIQTQIAAKAERVDRILCGIGQRLK